MEQIIDLTYDIEEGMTTFGAYWHPAVQITQLGRHDLEGRESRKVTLGTHSGTHVDAPSHFVLGGKTVEEIPIEKLIGPVTILDFSFLGENGIVTEEMLRQKEITSKIIFKFGWGNHWKKSDFYQGYPFLSTAAAKYLVQKKVELIATDTPSLDDSRINISSVLGSEEDSPIHKIILRNNIIQVEYVAHLDRVTNLTGWNIIVMPLRIKRGDGSPARVCLFK